MEYAHYNIVSIFEKETKLSSFKGSMMRGALGHALKDIVCAVRVKVCDSCLLRFTCIFPRIFEPKPASDKKSEQANRPHPYILDSHKMDRGYYKAGDEFTFSLLLFGSVIQYFPYFLYAFERMGLTGLGKRRDQGRTTFVLQEVYSGEQRIYTRESKNISMPLTRSVLSITASSTQPKQTASHVRIRLVSPLRVKIDGRFARDLDFVEFMRFVLRRLRMLFSEFSENEWNVDEKSLLQKATSITVMAKNIRWEEQVRYSNRQKTKLFIGGLSGTFEVNGDLTPFIQFLKAAEIVHLGKETSFGLGKIKIENLA
ncbi:MAG: CRISPR system precrRNA processing endoribonuclease RAMP protein Cas6 [Candidatus Thioglobus sp.]|nr:CRISPR system precrRNA processing endoribonuclease RAMP protein Cas6 [Candidatus Thioglobus sp.]